MMIMMILTCFIFQGGDSAAVMESTAGVQSVSTTGTTSELMSSKRNPEFILSVLLSLW